MHTRSNLKNEMTINEAAQFKEEIVEFRKNAIISFCRNNFRSPNQRNNYDEIFPNCFLGDSVAATDKILLKELEITHVLNAAQGKKFSQVNTDEYFYRDLKIKFFGTNIMDISNAHIDLYMDEAVEFIHEALDVKKGKIFIHCFMGVSRSATFMLAYMIKYRNFSLEEAIRLSSQKRYIAPNDGFLIKLINYETKFFSSKK